MEKLYFAKVLSSHNNVYRCPVESITSTLTGVQVYQFHYLYLGWKG